MLDVEEEEYEEKSWSQKLLGKDVSKVPCLKNSFVTGVTSGSITGLACFLFTSKAGISFNSAFYAYLIGASAYWCICRLQYENHSLAIKQNLWVKNREKHKQEKELKSFLNDTQEIVAKE